MKQYICENCVEVLKKDHKKLGDKTVWLVCHKCGYRTRATSEFFQNRKVYDEFRANIKRINTKWRDEDGTS